MKFNLHIEHHAYTCNYSALQRKYLQVRIHCNATPIMESCTSLTITKKTLKTQIPKTFILKMADFSSLLETLTISGATGGVVSAASSSPQQLFALSGKLAERCALVGKDEEAKVVSALNSFTALANEGN